MAVLVVAFGVYNVMRNMRLRASGLVTAPVGLTVLKAGAVAIAASSW